MNRGFRLGISLGEVSAQERLDQIWPLLQKHLLLTYPFLSSLAEMECVGTFAHPPQGTKGISWAPVEKMSVNGVRAVLPKIPFFWSLLRGYRQSFVENPLDLLILVDFADFNLRLAKLAQKQKIPTLWLAPPQMWAWRAERQREMKGVALGCLFEFEARLYQSWGLDAHWIGFKSRQCLQFDEGAPLGIFPGSRPSVIKRQAPLLLAIAQNYKRKCHRDFRWVLPNEKCLEWAQKEFPHWSEKMIVGSSDVKLCRALSLPGTATLEISLAGIPLQVIYKGSLWEKKWWLKKYQSRIPHFALPNILLQKRAYSESFFTNFDPDPRILEAEWPSAPDREKSFTPLLPESLIPDDEQKALENWVAKKA